VDALIHDLRHAVRQWVRAPLVTAMVLLSLALGIGATTAVVALVNAVHVQPLPVDDPDDLVQLRTRQATGAGVSAIDVSFDTTVWERIRESQTILAAVAAVAQYRVNLAHGGESRFAQLSCVSGSFFDAFGVPVAAGRRLTRRDDAPGAPLVAVVDHVFWSRELGGRPLVVGTSIDVAGRAVEIVGVTAPTFFGIEVGRRAQIYMTFAGVGTMPPSEGRLVPLSGTRVFGRLRPGQSRDAAAAAFRAWQPTLRQATLPSGSAAGEHLIDPLDVVSAARGVSPLRRDVGIPLFLLLGGVSVVLVIACANLAALMSARFADRRAELWMHRALGASTAQLVRRLLAETLLLSGVGALFGVALALWLARVLVPALMSSARQVAEPYLSLALDWRVLGTAALLAVVSGVVTGLPPALVASRATRAPHPPARGGVTGQGVSSRRIVAGLVAAQIALSCVLVSGAGTLVRSFLALTLQPLGVERDRVLLATLSGFVFDPVSEISIARLNALCERFRVLPGVQAVSASTVTPLGGLMMMGLFQVDAVPTPDQRERAVAINRVTSRFFEVFGTPMVAGRGFDDRVAPHAPLVAIVNQAFAQQYLAGRSPIGRQITVSTRRLEVVGVVATTKFMRLREPVMPVVYVPLAQSFATPQPIRLAFRSAGDGANIARGPILAALQAFDPRLTVEFSTLHDEVASSVTRERTLAFSGAVVGVLALLIAAIGLYGAFSNMVARRRGELAIRMALGADRQTIGALVARTAVVTVMMGAVAGLGAVVASARAVESVAFDVRALDPWTLAVTLAAVVVVAGVATFVPIRRAGRIDPLSYLRSE
jgi:putative ABC transport system permease protein